MRIRVKQVYFRDKLRQILSFSGINTARVNGLSFRKGGTSFLKRMGASVDFICDKGRWTSSACKHYVQMEITFKQQVKPLVLKKLERFLDLLKECNPSGAPLQTAAWAKAKVKSLKRLKVRKAKFTNKRMREMELELFRNKETG